MRIDVTDEESVAAAAKWIEAEYGSLDILVNNAGVAGGLDGGLLSAVTAREPREVYETNVFGVVTVTNAMLPLLRRSPAGRIVNMSSELGSISLARTPDSPFWDLNFAAYAHTGFRTAEQGAAIAVRLATLDADGPTGAYLEDGGPIGW
ncbi:SDR family NAD(P)-dependent oxidoreductase [Nonomuraea sp. NPDC049646]|uniref:SDR family NAD(P)-dependent oxidoreductase n=1 Tax=unclassified Nonomuraea TaxID=2593643 RepID=UPI0037B28AE4